VYPKARRAPERRLQHRWPGFCSPARRSPVTSSRRSASLVSSRPEGMNFAGMWARNSAPVSRPPERASRATERLVFRNVSRAFAEQCIQIGVTPRKFTGVLVSPYLFIQPTVEGFEYPRPDLPPQVHFVGALLPDPPREFRPPQWWDQVASSCAVRANWNIVARSWRSCPYTSGM
jgi:hypothetical protein